MSKKIDLKDLVNLFIKRIYIVILFVVVFCAAGFLWSKHAYHPVYSSESSFVVYHKEAKKRDSDLSFMPTYEKVLTNQIILKDVQSKMKHVKGYNGSASDLADSLEVSTESGTVIMKVTGHADSPKVAAALTNNTIKSFKEKANKLVAAGTVRQLAKATVNDATKNSANTKKYIILGGMIGLAAGILFILIFDWKRIFS